MSHPVVHFEIGCRDSSKTADFFSNLFGWNMQSMGPATMINTGATSGIHGHITALGHEPHRYTIFYVQVDDVQGYLAQGGRARRQDARAAGRDSHRHLRLVC
jgi:predicted enzyme related to lactoylglutathione lyase